MRKFLKIRTTGQNKEVLINSACIAEIIPVGVDIFQFNLTHSKLTYTGRMISTNGKEVTTLNKTQKILNNHKDNKNKKPKE